MIESYIIGIPIGVLLMSLLYIADAFEAAIKHKRIIKIAKSEGRGDVAQDILTRLSSTKRGRLIIFFLNKLK